MLETLLRQYLKLPQKLPEMSRKYTLNPNLQKAIKDEIAVNIVILLGDFSAQSKGVMIQTKPTHRALETSFIKKNKKNPKMLVDIGWESNKRCLD